MSALRAGTPQQNRQKLYADQMTAVNELRQAFNAAAQASGEFSMQTVKTISAQERLTNSIRQQKIGWGDARKELRAYKNEQKTGNASTFGEAIRAQQALRNSMATQWTGQPFGKNNTDLYIPKNLGSELDMANTKYGMINRMLYSASQNTINWGKNTQWAGRQITVGLAVPLGMAAVGAGALALKVDQELTRVAKVYDTVATTAAGKEAELAQVREVGLSQAKRLAQEYGTSMEDVIDIQAQLAATGLSGNKLFSSTQEAARIATLGEMDVQESIDMTVSLQTAFRDTIKSASDLTETFDFFNSVENATSLAIQDIAEATPRAASAMAALGVDAKEMTVMLVAMKESGVDAAEAANALKSGATRILDPTKEAVTYWDQVLDKDLPAIVKKAGGNMFEFIKEVSVALNGLDPQTVQTAIAKTFGTYQFNRITALIGNMGDALTGTANQTAKGFELLGVSAEENAANAANELAKLQESVSFRFKAAVNSVKAELIPLGMMALEIGTFILNNLITPLISGFKSLSGPSQMFVMGLLGLIALAGPLLMLTGIFANFFGNIMKTSLQIGNLRWKFKAMSAEEAAAAINARTASSAFSTEAGAAAYLSQQIQILTKTMQENAIASGQMMNSMGQRTMNNFTRQVQRVPGTENFMYAAGSKDANGNSIAGHSGKRVDPADIAAFKAMEERTGGIAKNTEKAERSMSRMAGAVGAIGVGALAFQTIRSDSEAASSKWINIAMTAGMIATIMPSIFTVPARAIGNMVTGLKTAGSPGVLGKIRAGFAGIADKARIISSTSIAAGGGAKGFAAGAGALRGMIPHALKVFGPLGIIAGGALLIKNIYDDMVAMEQIQRDLAGSAKDWSEALGFDFNPGQLPGIEKDPEDAAADARAELATKMGQANKGLADSLDEVGDKARNAGGSIKDYGKAYEMAMWEAMKAISTGASPDQAKQVLEASLEMAGADPFTISQLSLRFGQIDLEDPTAVRQAIMDAIETRNTFTADMGEITPSESNDGFWSGVKNSVREAFGGDLSDEMRASGIRLGESLYTGIQAAGSNNAMKSEIFDQYTNQINNQFEDMINDIRERTPVIAQAMDNLGIETADELAGAIARIKEKADEGKELTADEEFLLDSGALKNFEDSYSELLDVVAQGWGESQGWDSDQIDNFRDSLTSLGNLRFGQGVKESYNEIEFAEKKYSEAFKRSGDSWNDETKLVVLNSWRASAGLEKATTWAQGFGEAGTTSSKGIWALAEAAAAVANETVNAADAMMNFTKEDVQMLVDGRKKAYGDTMNDIYGEADRQFQEMQEKNADSIRAAGEARQDAIRAEGDLMDKDFDRREKDMDNFWNAREKGFDKEWDNREKAFDREWDAKEKAAEEHWENRIEEEENYWDSRIEGIEKSIEAENEAEERRQEIFEAEQRRIERMASSLNSNIDFNVALNSGDLDEAAKIANDSIAQQESWSLEDQNRDAQSESEERVEKLESQLEELQKLKEARLDEINSVKEARLAQLKEEREAHQEALRAEQAAARENLQLQRQMDQERLASERESAKAALDARIDADRKETESAVKNDALQAASQRRAMEMELRTLREFIPQNEEELRIHTAKVEEVYQKYGLNLQQEGNKWGQFVGDALKVNVDVAAASMQNEINWRAIAKNIGDQIGEGLGMTMGQVQEFLRTGVFPAGPQTAAPYKPATNISSANAAEKRAGFGMAGWHSGGPVEAGRKNSQANRVGVPRSAGVYPSEVPAVLKDGEYVVKSNAARQNRGLLDAINGGADIGGTGLLGYTTAVVAGQMTTAMQVAGMAAAMKTKMAKQAYDAEQAALAASMAGGSTGTIAGGNAPWQRLWNTIKGRFPQAGLNSAYEDRKGDPGYHGKGMAVDLGLAGTPGGAGNSYIADMNRWIYDNFRGSTELIYNGLGDDRPNLKNGANLAYSAATQAAHRNHVHWAMTPEAIAAAGRAIASGTVGPAPAGGDVRAQVQAAANQRGWGSGANWDAINWVIGKESSWNPNAQNPVSTASGLFQHIDKTWNAYKRPGVSAPKMRLAPVNEQAWAGMNYFSGRYGSPVAARNFWQQKGWYDNGGYLQPGATMAMNGTRTPEPVFTGPQWDILKANIGTAVYDVPSGPRPMAVRVVDDVASSGETRYDVTVDLRGAVIRDDIDFQAGVEKALDNIENRKGRKRRI